MSVDVAETSVAEWNLQALREGQSASLEKTIEAADIDAFASLSGDISLLHMDAEFARRRGFYGRVVHGALIISYISRLLGVYLPGRDCLIHSTSVRFLVPVLQDDTIIATITLKQISEAVRTLVFDVAVINKANGTEVAKGKVQVGLTKEVT